MVCINKRGDGQGVCVLSLLGAEDMLDLLKEPGHGGEGPEAIGDVLVGNAVLVQQEDGASASG